MARVTIEDCLKDLDSRFSLVHLAVRRVLQLRAGAPLLINAPKNKEIVLALREIAANKVTPSNIRQLEDERPVLEPPAAVAPTQAEETARMELKEILDAATQFDPSATMDYAEPEQPAGEDEE